VARPRQPSSGRIEASQRAVAILDALADAGEVGTNEPLASIESALQRFPADEIVVATPPLDEQGWLEHGIVRDIRARTELPVTHVLPGGERNQAAAARR